MKFRTDPLTDDGKFDDDFFMSPFYETEKKCLVDYLILEGFENETDDFIIDFRSRRWHVLLSNNS
jgi:hypothetical protein